MVWRARVGHELHGEDTSPLPIAVLAAENEATDGPALVEKTAGSRGYA